jgi:hypothetical protein
MNPTIEIPAGPISITRQQNILSFRERQEEEKYYLQLITTFDETGTQIDSGFVQLNDYTKGCTMVRILNKFEKHLHIFKCWEHYGDQYLETEKYKIMDLATNRCCNDYHTYQEIETGLIDCELWGLVRCPHKIETTAESRTPFHGDLERDIYSEALLECLEEHKAKNNPYKRQPEIETKTETQAKTELEAKLCCHLEEILNIEDACFQGLISRKEETKLINDLTCICKQCHKKEIPEEIKKRAQEEVEFVLQKVK